MRGQVQGVVLTRYTQKHGLSGWLSKHAVLARCIEHTATADLEDIYTHVAENEAASEQLAAALTTAGALPRGLMLQSLKTCSVLVMSAAATCRTLTSLDLGLNRESLFPSARDTATCITGRASQLRSLKLRADVWHFADGIRAGTDDKSDSGLHCLMQQTLPQLTTVTSLEVQELPNACILKYAPAQLLELSAMGVADEHDESLDLGHLAALTRLQLTRSPLVGKEGWRDIKAEDKLPPNLKRFAACNCLSAAPLLALTSLEALSIGPQCRMLAAELQRLRTMTHLSHVELAYTKSKDSTGWDNAAQQGLAAWEFVPALCELHLHNVELNPTSPWVYYLADLTNLTRLVWDGVRFMDTARIDELQHTGDIAAGINAAYNEGGLTDLGKALPHSLVSVEFRNVLPRVNRFTLYSAGEWIPNCSNEDSLLWGLMRLKVAVSALPNLKSCRFDAHSETFAAYYSEKFAKLLHVLWGCQGEDWQQPVPVWWRDEFDRIYPHYSHYATTSDSGSESDVGSDHD